MKCTVTQFWPKLSLTAQKCYTANKLNFEEIHYLYALNVFQIYICNDYNGFGSVLRLKRYYFRSV